MSNNERKDGLPLSFDMALAEDPYAMARFTALSDPERRAVINGALSLTCQEELRAYLDSFVGSKEPKGPVQL